MTSLLARGAVAGGIGLLAGVAFRKVRPRDRVETRSSSGVLSEQPASGPDWVRWGVVGAAAGVTLLFLGTR